MTLIRSIFLFTLLSLLAFSAQAAQLLERIVAVVEDQPILQSELDQAISATLSQLRQRGITPPPADVLRKRVLEQLILEKIQLLRAKQRGIQVSDDEVNAQLQQIAAQNGLTLAQLQQMLDEQQPGGFAQLRESVHKRLTIEKLRHIEVVSRIQVTENDVDQFLKQQAGGNLTRYKLRHILIALPSAPTQEQVAEAQAKAEQLYQQVQNGADFSALAVQHSQGQYALQGGDLGWRSENELPDLFLDALDKLQPGMVTPPLKSPSGYHLLKLEEKGNTLQASERDRQQALMALRQRKASELFDLWLRRLRDEAHVEIYLDDEETLKP
ncbi:MAG TPA: peptidylprolyl isomerase [Sulfurivirga caldicuralii]|nr:peptidylprolyl isomerase [Sulfurivirga caldicuralii]